MKRLIQTLIFSVLASLGILRAEDSPQRPNILYFYVDDMGWGSIGPNGQAARKAANQPSVLTPNLDRLAASGINFTRGYGCTVCSPARSSQQSGFHQGHTWGDRNDPNNAKKAMRSDEVLMGDALSAAGYTTGYWGKWGYGGSEAPKNPVIQNVQTLPTSHGYQHVLAELHHVRAHTFFQPTLWKAPASPGATSGLELVRNSVAGFVNKPGFPDTPAYQSHISYPSTAYCDDSYAFAALEFVRNQAQEYHATGKPFFGLFAAQIPHAPFEDIATLPYWDQAYADDPHFSSLPKQARQWAAMVSRIDAHFGNILAALEDPNNDGDTSDSVASNTLVVFQSDNGGPGGDSNTVLDANGGLRGNKGSIYEGGIRVPTVVCWPSRINGGSQLTAGSNSSMVIDVTDLLPTFCELAGTEIPAGIDGVSIAPTLLSSGHQRPREFLIHEAGGNASIIRGKNKLVISRATNGKRTKRKETPARLALYDLEADPSESTDVSSKNPQLVKELHALLLGERVSEPDDFANTYHRWTGEDQTNTSDAAHWSDYVYENDGTVYLADKGVPRVSWTATMKNTGSRSSTAYADADLEFLSLEIRGTSEMVRQSLELGQGVDLTGRNEIRLAAHSVLTVNNGSVSSLRWVDIQSKAELHAAGTIDAHLYNAGLLAATGNLTIEKDYRAAVGSKTKVSLPIAGDRLNISGEAALAGALEVSIPPGSSIKKGDTFTIISARSISGTFNQADDEVTPSGGPAFTISYSATAVTLTAQ